MPLDRRRRSMAISEIESTDRFGIYHNEINGLKIRYFNTFNCNTLTNLNQNYFYFFFFFFAIGTYLTSLGWTIFYQYYVLVL